MRTLIIVALAAFLLILPSCIGGQTPDYGLVLRSPIIPDVRAQGDPMRQAPAYQTPSWGQPQVQQYIAVPQAQGFPAPARVGCP